MWLIVIACVIMLGIGFIEKKRHQKISMPCRYASILMVYAESLPLQD